MTTQSRQPSGTPVGGQFAAGAKADPDTAVQLTEQQPTRPGEAEARAGMVTALGLDSADQVTSDIEDGSCYQRYMTLTAPVPDDPWNRTVEVSYGMDGGRELRAGVSWPIEPLRGLPEVTSASVVSQYSPSPALTEDAVTDLVRDVLDQSRLQRALNLTINDPQSQRNLDYRSEHQRPRQWYETLAFETLSGGAEPAIRVTNRQSGHHRPVDLRVDPETGALRGGTIETDHGQLNLEGENLDRVAASVHRDLLFAFDDFDGAMSASRATLENALAAIVAYGREPHTPEA